MHTQRRMRPLLGTFVEVGAQSTSSALLMPAISAAFEALERVQQRMSFHGLNSELTRLNQSEGAWVALSRETLRVLRLARATMLASGGLFDPTVGGLLIKHGALPDHGGGKPLDRGLASDLELSQVAARLLRPVRLTLDGVAKGHAVDQAIQALRAQGVAGGWVNAGGDLRVFGVASLPVQQRKLDGQLLPLGTLRDAAMASSRTVTSPEVWATDQASFPGLVMPPEHQQAQEGVWTVLARTCWRADALTKVAALAPPMQREALVRRLGGMLLHPT